MATVKKPTSKIVLRTHFECQACGAVNRTQICPHCHDGDGIKSTTRSIKQ